ncbi:MAG: hypothetical protein K9K67_13005 [Bacteriovoracaceae bacterium]|nr:hypothetical protein [Bacteriovoracaceae bacterium]
MKNLLFIISILSSAHLLADRVLESQASNTNDLEIGKISEIVDPSKVLPTADLTMEEIQTDYGRLAALYAQRDSVAKGLHALGYDVCMKSRFARVENLSARLIARQKGLKGPINVEILYDCPPGEKCDPPTKRELYGDKIILPLKNNRFKFQTEMKKTKVLERLLGENKESDSDKEKRGFHGLFFKRTSCIEGSGLMKACKLLSSDRPIKDAKLKRLKALIEKDLEFKENFDGERACQIADSKSRYIETLKEINKSIAEEEKKIIKEKKRGGADDRGDRVDQIGKCQGFNEDGTPLCGQ